MRKRSLQIVPTDDAQFFGRLSPWSRREIKSSIGFYSVGSTQLGIVIPDEVKKHFEKPQALKQDRNSKKRGVQDTLFHDSPLSVKKTKMPSSPSQSILSSSYSPKAEETKNAELIKKQQIFRTGCWRVVKHANGPFLGSIETTGKDSDKVTVKQLDPAVPVEDWSCRIVEKDDLHPVFTSTSHTMDELIHNLKQSQILRSDLVEQALRWVDRQYFCRESNTPYNDCAVDIGDKELGVCISSPHMHTWAAELLKDHLVKADKCLDVGSGSGYFTALMQYLCPSQAKVYGIEHYQSLIEESKINLNYYTSKKHTPIWNIEMYQGNGEEGLKNEGEFNAIHVGFMCMQEPLGLIEQLAPGGRMVVPIWDGKSSSFDKRCLSGHYVCIDKFEDGTFRKTPLFTCSFVPSSTFTSEECPIEIKQKSLTSSSIGKEEENPSLHFSRAARRRASSFNSADSASTSSQLSSDLEIDIEQPQM